MSTISTQIAGLRLIPQSAAPSGAVEGDYFESDGTTYPKGVYRYANSQWNKMSITKDSNYIANQYVASFSTYADAAGVSPVDATGGSPNSTLVINTIDPLRDDQDLLFTVNSGATRQGEGFSVPFIIDNIDLSRMQEITFDYDLSHANYVDGDFRVYVIDVTNPTVIEPTLVELNGGTGTFKAFFQASSNSTSYRLAVHVARSSATTEILSYFKNFKVYTATSPITTSGRVYGSFYRTVNQVATGTAEVLVLFDGVTEDVYGAYSSGTYTVKVAGDYIVNTQLTLTGIATSPYRARAIVKVNGTEINNLTIPSDTPGNGVGVSPTNIIPLNVGDTIQVYARSVDDAAYSVVGGRAFSFLEILKVGSPDQYNSGAAVSLGAYRNAAWTHTNGASTFQTIPFDTIIRLNGISFNTSTGVATIQESGDYYFKGQTRFSSLTSGSKAQSRFVINGGTTRLWGNENPFGATSAGQVSSEGVLWNLKKGDTVEYQVTQNDSASEAVNVSELYTFINAFKLASPTDNSTVLAKVVEIWRDTSGQAVVDGSTITFNTVIKSTHGAFNGTSFTAPRSGILTINLTVRTDAVTATVIGQRFGVVVRLGGVDQAEPDYDFADQTTTARTYIASVPIVLDVLKNDVVTLAFDETLPAVNLRTDALSNRVTFILE